MSPKDLTKKEFFLNVEKGRALKSPVRIAKECQIFFTRNWLKRKILFELNVDRDGIKEVKAVKTVVRVKY